MTFISALFIIAKARNDLNAQLRDWSNKLKNIHTTEFLTWALGMTCGRIFDELEMFMSAQSQLTT